jgi:hypothetical protein
MGPLNTQELVHQLASDLRGKGGPASARAIASRLATMTGLGSLVSLAAILLLLSRSPHFEHGPTPTIMFTALTGIALAGGAFWAALRSSYPESRAGFLWLLFPLAVLLLGVGLEMSRTPSSTWLSRVWGANPLACYVFVTLLSVPMVAAALAALREGAPTHPRLCGAMVGLLAGGITAALYTIHCPENSLLFIATWHILAVLTVSIGSAFVAERYLRW